MCEFEFSPRNKHLLSAVFCCTPLPKKRWFKPKKTKKLFDDNDITPLQFLNCMDNSVRDLQTLNSVLSSKYKNVPKNIY